MENHMKRLELETSEHGFVDVMDIYRFTVCNILICICFGAKLSEDWIKEIDAVTKDVMMITMPQLPDFFPVLTMLFRRQVKRAKEPRKTQIECLVPLIKNRRAYGEKGETSLRASSLS
ncbi:cytochrome P450 family 77 subfamily B polypeptide 1 [Euphorbia peplus]|nr:cytochrome P450 family 77 subfamily B polypeptide 1 [Euphorbia peplus]